MTERMLTDKPDAFHAIVKVWWRDVAGNLTEFVPIPSACWPQCRVVSGTHPTPFFAVTLYAHRRIENGVGCRVKLVLV